MEHINKILAVSAVLAALALGYATLEYRGTAPKAGGYLASSVTNTSSTVGMTDTLVLNATSGVQYLYVVNTGAGNIDCTWTTTSTLTGTVVGTGLRLEAATLTTSTTKSYDTTDQTLLAKYMHCIANTTSTLGILRYGSN